MATNRPWIDPIDAYAALRDLGAVLLDGRGDHPDAGLSIIGLSPAWTATIDDGLTIRHADGRTEHRDGEPLALLRELCTGMRRDVQEADPFTGGIMGSIGYEFLHAIEPTLPRRRASTPDAWLRLCRDAVVIDHVRQETRIWIDEDDTAPERRRDILARLDAAIPIEAPAAPAAAAWSASLDAAAHAQQVQRLRELIAQGDLFQANIATRFSRPLDADPVRLFRAIVQANPSPFMALIEADDHAIVSGSPERLLDVRDGRITTRPIAGTRRRGRDTAEDDALEQELRSDAKERAEHTMLVDLLRNDIAKVSVPGTVHVPEEASIERYSHVMHLVSRVDGQVRPGTDFVDWLAALFPGGTITGAPKHRACLRIHEAEPVARGPYTGSAGYLSWSHNAQWNIMIRTLVLQDGEAHVHAGGGIVADSVDGNEWEEAGHKAQALLDVATGRPAPSPGRIGDVQTFEQWRPATPGHVEARVLVIDNYDSFTYNLADQCASLGAQVVVVRNDADWRAAAADLEPTHIILSPGPGRPEDSGASLEVLRDGPNVPVLGVCLGHQAMGHVTGARIDVVPPVHGKPAMVHHDGWFDPIPSPFQAARYHSLIVARNGLPDAWHVDAWLEDGTIMAMHHTQRPWMGLQVHPESICTPQGLDILTRFLDGRFGPR